MEDTSATGRGELDSEAELARKLGEMERTVRTWRVKGMIPYIRLGHKTIRYRLDAVLAALEKRQIKKRYFVQQPQ